MKFKDLKIEYLQIKENIYDRLKRIMEDGDFILGKEVFELEEKLSHYVNKKYCLTCGNGTDGLILALMAAGVKNNDTVLVPAFSYIASASCISLLGAKPFFVDISPITYNISPESLEKAIIQANKYGIRPKAVITVDLFGCPADYIQIKKIAKKNHLIIIEDGAQGFGARIGNQKACSFGDICVTSFFPVKPLGAYGDGGAIFTDDDDFYHRIWSLRSNGRSELDKYQNDIVGFNSRLDTIQAAILLEKMELFDPLELTLINNIASEYTSKLGKYVITPSIPEYYYSSWAQYTIQTANENERDKLVEFLRSNDIPTMVYYRIPLHKQLSLIESYRVDDLSVTESIVKKVLSLPIYAFMDHEAVAKVIDTIYRFYIS